METVKSPLLAKEARPSDYAQGKSGAPKLTLEPDECLPPKTRALLAFPPFLEDFFTVFSLLIHLVVTLR